MNIGRWSLGLVTDYEECRQEKKKEAFFGRKHSPHMYIKKNYRVYFILVKQFAVRQGFTLMFDVF